MVLCAGLGTRLRPLTDERPKPLVPVVGRPLASYALDVLAHHGARHVVANAHHLAAQIEPGLRPFTDRHGMTLTVLREETILGTGGGIRNALPHLGGGDFVVFNGDVLSAPDLTRVMAHHRDTGALLTMVLREDPRAERAGVIELTRDGRVVRMLNEGPAHEAPTARCLFTGIYVVSSALAEDLPAEGCVVRHTLRRLLSSGRRVSGVIDTGPWFDLGTPAAYLDANLAMLRGEIAMPGFAPPQGGSFVGEGVSPGAVTVRSSVLGDGAMVTGEGALDSVVVWDGARIEAPCARTIVSRSHRVAVP